ncbi:MAG: spore photoproduct lyase [Clostridiales bacterium]|nr:spore photoproduct lyase [Clostridiales bacterium]
MKLFIPDKVFINPVSMEYEVGRFAREQLEKLNVPIVEGRRVLIEGEFSLSSSCPGHCEYCYLQTTQGEKPYMKVFVNIEEILAVIQKHIDENLPNIMYFECGSITDPIALEHLTGNLKRCVEFFAHSENGRLRIVTKYNNIDSFLDINHNNHTKFRFSINTRYIIKKFEHNTSSFEERIEAARKISKAGYPLGFIIAPIMIYDNWQKDYRELLDKLKSELEGYEEKITFELIQHRFTNTAKELILKRFPKTELDLNEENRQLKWGPYGKFKHVYPKEKSNEIRDYISQIINENFLNAEIEYFT